MVASAVGADTTVVAAVEADTTVVAWVVAVARVAVVAWMPAMVMMILVAVYLQNHRRQVDFSLMVVGQEGPGSPV